MGAAFLIGYIILIGTATFLLKFGMRDLNPYQLNLLMGIGMIVTGVPALWFFQKSLTIPVKALPLGAGIGVMMAVGSLLYVLALSKLPAGLTAAVATAYVVLVVILSWLILHESVDIVKAIGILLTVGGVAILAFKG